VPKQLSPLTGFRGVAAYAVLVAHAAASSFVYGTDAPLGPLLSRLAYFGMSLFFVLSGFVIQHNYGVLFAKEPLRRALYLFFVARFARIYPLYLITLVPALAYIPSPYFSGEWAAALSYLTLTQSWFNVEMAVFAPDWSISTEWFFYFAFVPLTLIVIRRPLAALVVAGAIGVVALAAMFMFFQTSVITFVEQCCVHDAKVSASAWGWMVYFSPLVRLPEFIMGMLAAKAYAAMSRRPQNPATARIVIGASLAWCAAAVVFSAAKAPFIGPLMPNFMFAPAIAPLLLYCCLHDGLLSRAMSSKPLLFAGQISYSVYIWSWSALTLLGPSFASPEPSALAYFNSGVKLMACIGFTTVFAYGSYLLIEAPARAYLRARLVAGNVVAPAASVRRVAAAQVPARPREVFARLTHSWNRLRIDAVLRRKHAIHPRRFLHRPVDNIENQRPERPARDRAQAV
jgi:peptidoglycan/LPS O-acetylase OafA/YrhL